MSTGKRGRSNDDGDYRPDGSSSEDGWDSDASHRRPSTKPARRVKKAVVPKQRRVAAQIGQAALAPLRAEAVASDPSAAALAHALLARAASSEAAAAAAEAEEALTVDAGDGEGNLPDAGEDGGAARRDTGAEAGPGPSSSGFASARCVAELCWALRRRG
jgi:hypothetical protein